MAEYQEQIKDIIWDYRGLGCLHGGTQFAILCLIPESKGSNSDYTAIPQWHDDEKKHAEDQLLETLDQQYEDFHGKPKALILYSWIVPCLNCTQAIIDKLKSPPFVEIRDRVVAYTTQGKYMPHCDEEESKRKFSGTGITFFRYEYYPCKFGECEYCHINNSRYCCKYQCLRCRELHK